MTIGPVKVLHTLRVARGLSVVTDIRTYIRKDGKITPSVCTRVMKYKLKGRLGKVGDEID